ncbi:tRNA (adenosine(37)-N6)-dimethylallyltransferase MiaA [Chamaesiphon sp. GL140_3_metabinner_50]|uniref:tRNA (adenosine(37)-N6)-dimethylallyltransferase MiaA n=1 Tax=Chamaesiphon sp. GL140_3_metabinner_50 TaxID=2970812 RepID=UPI0025DFC70E|nr:tRNA (adenosine(37)-N6)-dimethylallyltransferase MiaA [Chamaesiphon sp. GL140_3_metabinner_50]
MLIVICGATATGKSGLAISIAQRLNSVIISADSRQIYREFDIATAKVSSTELALTPHYLVSTFDPNYTVTVSQYQSRAQILIDRFQQQGKIPLLVGGTGLYIKSVVKGMKMPRVAANEDLRSQLTNLGQVQCYQILQQVDPQAASKIYANDPRRTIRALEVYYVTGQTISSQQGEYPPSYPILQIGLDCENLDILAQRIEQRTQQMIELGWENEVRYLGAKYGWDLPLLKTLGYAQMQQYLEGKISLVEAINLTTLLTRQFAKRQRTWFKAIPNIEWFDSNDPILLDRVWTRVQEFRGN